MTTLSKSSEQHSSRPKVDITISEALVSDAAAIALIGANTFTATFGFSVPEQDLVDYLASTYTTQLVEADVLDPGIATIVARDTEKVLGFVQLVRGLALPSCPSSTVLLPPSSSLSAPPLPTTAAVVAGDCFPGPGREDQDLELHEKGNVNCGQAELRRLYVDTNAHGRGVGTKLMAAVEARAKAQGFETLWLTVWEENSIAQRLYQKLGYVKVGEADFATGTCVQTDLVLAKQLSSL